jgi:hypothetical protein
MGGIQSFVVAIYSQAGTQVVPWLFFAMMAAAAIAFLFNARRTSGAIAIAAVGGTLFYYMVQPMTTSLLAVMPKGG